MVGCSVLGCKSRSEHNISGITFHSFPSNPETKLKCLEATGRENWQPTKYIKICSLHFGGDALIFHKKLVKIRTNAVPSRLIHGSGSNNQNELISLDDHMMYRGLSTSLADTEEIIPMSQASTSRESREILRDVQDIQPKKLCLEPSSNLNDITKSGGLVAQQAIMSTPRKEKRLKKLLQTEKIKSASRLKKLRAIRQSKRRLLKKVADLESVIMELKCKMQMKSEELDLLSNI